MLFLYASVIAVLLAFLRVILSLKV